MIIVILQVKLAIKIASLSINSESYITGNMKRERISELVAKAMHGKSASAFGREMGVSHTTVANWLKGEHMPDLDSLAVIAKKAGITIEEAIFYILDTKASGDINAIQRQIRALDSTKELLAVIETATSRLQVIAV